MNSAGSASVLKGTLHLCFLPSINRGSLVSAFLTVLWKPSVYLKPLFLLTKIFFILLRQFFCQDTSCGGITVSSLMLSISANNQRKGIRISKLAASCVWRSNLEAILMSECSCADSGHEVNHRCRSSEAVCHGFWDGQLDKAGGPVSPRDSPISASPAL